ncbi:UPF0430 protein CG31712-like, partial [Cynara cardunculus var. scolymus]|uniref:UPF0430 protein CG31712-like n=1 Tax=Cynara cardunculus var. scolymus TaxID=59895 RepID=UPI000D62F268
MTSFFEKENKELKEKICELEQSQQSYKDKYVNVFYENHVNEELVKNLKREHKEAIERDENNSTFWIRKLENTLDYERKGLDEEIRSSNKIKQDPSNKLQKAEFELNAKRNSPEKKNKEVEELTEKLRKSENELIDERKLLDQEKDK